MASQKRLTHLDMNGNEIQNVSAQKLASHPGSPVEGQEWYLTTDDSKYLQKGAGTRKILDADDIQDDDNFASPSASKVPSAESVKAYVDSSVNGRSWIKPVRVMATGNVNLASALANGQTIDGVTLVTGDRVAVPAQTTGSQNGIYIVPVSGTASRSSESGSDLTNKQFFVNEGTANGNKSFAITNDTITLGTTTIDMVQNGGSSAPDASTTTKGIVELATQAEAQAKSDSTRAVTPASLADFTRKYSADFSSSTGATVTAATHGLGATKALQVSVYEDGSPNTLVGVEITVADNGDVVWASNTSISGHIVIIG